MNKFQKLPTAEVRKGDHPKMIEAIQRLKREKIDVRRPLNANFQLKVAEEISFYPGKGTIFVDGTDGAHERRGLEAVIELVNGSKGLGLSFEE